ncbi:hypothetical protein RND71_038266 [Anisodus tanguticus]|uniref:Uncharacterized protein n=1 Tax=Anisodus tanguticus TaxID=243964 RepID=A0AAE1QZD1_9SOLA|nr:hypothetical protein RND71_038266 [Anisodus tanguticus]
MASSFVNVEAVDRHSRLVQPYQLYQLPFETAAEDKVAKGTRVDKTTETNRPLDQKNNACTRLYALLFNYRLPLHVAPPLHDDIPRHKTITYFYAAILLTLFEANSSTKSSYVNNIEFDYMEYARGRFEQYWLKKSEPGSDNLLQDKVARGAGVDVLNGYGKISWVLT